MIKSIFKLIKAKFNEKLGRPLPVKLTIAYTFLCNSQCKICNIWKIYRENPEKLKDELNYNDWIELLEDLDKSLIWLEITGGEPFLKKDLKEVLLYLVENSSIKAIGITTNALLNNKIKDILEEIAEVNENKKIINIGISLDGKPEVHNFIRGVDAFDKAISLYSELKKLDSGIKVHFAYTISQFNAGKFEEFYNFMKENYNLNITDLTITIEHFTEFYNRNAGDNSVYYNLKERIKKDIEFYLAELYKEKQKVKDLFMKIKLEFYEFYAKNILRFIENPRKMIIPCVAGKFSAYIDPYGNVYPCTQWLVKLGNIKEEKFERIWNSNKAKEIRKLIKEEKCPNCWTPCEAQSSWLFYKIKI